jgi:hypothetical protein
MTPIMELVDYANLMGLRVNNLFQVNDTVWQANVTNDENEYEFGTGSSMEEALQNALTKAGYPI